MVDKKSLEYLSQCIDDLSRGSSKLYLAEQNIKNENDNGENQVLLEFINNIYTNVMESMHELKAKRKLYHKYPNS